MEATPPDDTYSDAGSTTPAVPASASPPGADGPATSSLPVNRIVAFLGPVIAVVAGAAADWLAHVIDLGLFNTGRDETAKTIAQMIVFVLTAGLVWLGQSKWLSGWQRYESGPGRAG